MIFHVQDSDSPRFVIAQSWEAALAKWRQNIADDNAEDPSDEYNPQGIHLIAEDDEIIL